jgi:transketolase
VSAVSITPRTSPRLAFGQALANLAARYPDMLVLDPDVATSTMTSAFLQACPERFLRMGIAEANAVCAAAGLAACGFTPWVSTFAVFLAKRALDQIRVSVAYTGLSVKLNGAYAGLPTGRAGATHSSVQDLAVMRAMPGMTVLSPADAAETRAMVALAMETRGPVYLRTVRCEVPDLFDAAVQPRLGEATELAEGEDLAIIGEGLMSFRAREAARLLAKEGIRARVLHMGSIKPLDRQAVISAARECGRILTVENHSVHGGLGGAICEVVSEAAPCFVQRLGFPDCFMESGDDEAIYSRLGLDAEGIAKAARALVRAG